MRDDLVAYLLNDADPEQRKRIEQHLANDPIWQHEYERLRDCMEAYKANPEEAPCLPEDLVHRTCTFVQRAVQEGKCVPTGTLVSASLSESRDGCTGRRKWRPADVGVGCGIALAFAMLLFPAVVESRDAARRAKCQHNMFEIGASLAKYAQIKDGFLPQGDLKDNVGMFVIELADSGVISREELDELRVCPNTQLAEDVATGKVLMKVPTREELSRVTPGALAVLRKHMGGSFAYRFGIFNKGKYRPIEFVGRGDAPMLADAPSFSVAGFQSANHDGCGQNVLYQDLSSRYLTDCVFANHGDHLFLNADGRHAAGRSDNDAVLGLSEATPEGMILPVSQ